MLEYSIEELLPVVSWLSEKYIEKQSCPVTYEVAVQLMDAVRYCIREHAFKRENSFLSSLDPIPAKRAYAEGYQLVVLKTRAAKECYERMMEEYTDYGCRYYSDTVVKEIPYFFEKYDPMFAPQKELLTLNYPLMNFNQKLSGIDKIGSYLETLEMEQRFLKAFMPFKVQSLLRKRVPEYESFYQNNITEPVFLRALGLMIANEKISELSLSSSNYTVISDYFQSQTDVQILIKLQVLTEKLMHYINVTEERMTEYFLSCCQPLAERIMHAVAENYISAIF